MLRVCLLALLSLLSIAPSRAQASLPSERVLAARLASGEPRLVAWAAHDVFAARDQAFIPDLLALAAQWRDLPQDGAGLTPEQIDARDAMAAVLDTLIQMQAEVPAETLRTLAPDFGNAVAILLSRLRSEDAGALAFDFLRVVPNRGQYALRHVSASFLALQPVPGFAAYLLADTKVTAAVFAISPGADRLGRGGGSGDCGGRDDGPRRGWPLTGQYTLTDRKGDGSTLVIGGVNPAYAVRELSTRYGENPCAAQLYADLTPKAHLRLLAEMLRIAPEALGWRTEPVLNIEFHSPQQFYRELTQFITDEQSRFRATAAALATERLLTLEQIEQSLPELHLTVMDNRGPGATPIPAPTSLPPRVVWDASGLR